ncbi:MAG: hypothetical protein R2680_15080 [Nitrososphaeraceae archaeon]
MSLSTNTLAFMNNVETKVNRNLKKRCYANYDYETRDNLLLCCK